MGLVYICDSFRVFQCHGLYMVPSTQFLRLLALSCSMGTLVKYFAFAVLWPPPSREGKLLPVQEKFWQVVEELTQRMQGQLYVCVLVCLVGVVCIQLFTIFVPFLRGQLLMINEYAGLPEHTLLGDSYVQNAQYVNHHALGGRLVSMIWSLIMEALQAPRDGTFAQVLRTKPLEAFIKINSNKYYYDEARQMLVLFGPMTPEELIELERSMARSKRPD